jgi:serine/threonine protein kinase
MLFEALAGYPPFAGATVDETWQNLKRWQKVLRKPVYEDPNYFLSRRTWDLITKLVAGKEQRFKNINEIHAHDYFSEVDFDRLREQRAPFVPELDSETDAGYFDDFSNEADMAKYKEVHDKQRALEDMADRDDKMNKGLFVGFTFRYVLFTPGPIYWTLKSRSLTNTFSATASPPSTALVVVVHHANRSRRMAASEPSSRSRLSQTCLPFCPSVLSHLIRAGLVDVYVFNGAFTSFLHALLLFISCSGTALHFIVLYPQKQCKAEVYAILYYCSRAQVFAVAGSMMEFKIECMIHT